MSSAKFSSSLRRSGRSKKLRTESAKSKLEDKKKRAIFECAYCRRRFVRKSNFNSHEILCKLKPDSLRDKSAPTNQVEAEGESPPFEYTIIRFPYDDDQLPRTSDNESSNEPESSIGNINTDELFETEIIPLTDESEYENLSGSETPSKLRPISAEIDYDSLSASMKRYLRDRKPYVRLGPEDFDTPLKRLLNLKYGQQTVAEYKDKISGLKAEKTRLERKKKQMQERIIKLLERRNEAPFSSSNTSNGVPPVSSNISVEMPSSPDTSINFVSVDTNMSPNSSDTLTASPISINTDINPVEFNLEEQSEELLESICDTLKTKIRAFNYADDLNTGLEKFKSRIENAKSRKQLLRFLHGSRNVRKTT